MIHIKAPQKFSDKKQKKIFLAGSIEMGAAENWQDKIARLLEDEDVVILNPRRDDWDSSWKQEKNDPQFRQQVLWELKAQEEADIIVMYFDPKTKSPITLLELGLFANTGKMMVCCPKGFWRKGNVDIVCERYNVSEYNSIEEIVKGIKPKLKLTEEIRKDKWTKINL